MPKRSVATSKVLAMRRHSAGKSSAVTVAKAVSASANRASMPGAMSAAWISSKRGRALGVLKGLGRRAVFMAIQMGFGAQNARRLYAPV